MRRPRRLVKSAAAVVIAALATLPSALGAAPALPSLSFDHYVFKHAGGEPDMTISPSGKTVLVAGLSLNASPAVLYRSLDGGKTFAKLSPTFDRAGGGDWDMQLLDDHNVIAGDLALSDGIYVDRSTDAGQTWTSTRVLTDVYDRPWIAHYGRDKVYLVTKGFDGVPYLYRSTDGGASFGALPIPLIIYGLPTQTGGPNPSDAFVTNQDAYVDHLIVDQRSGDLYILYGIGAPDSYNARQPAGASNHLYVAHLVGDTLVSHPVFIGGADDSFISGFNWMTVDPNGTVYVLADGRINGHHSARLSYSKDHGTTWSSLVDLAPRGAANVYGAIAAGKPGELALAYIRGTNEDPSTAQLWYAEMAKIKNADTAAPKVQHVRGLSAPIHTKDICFSGILCGVPGFGNDRTLLDFIWADMGPDGRAWGVFSSDGPATNGSANPDPDVLVLREHGSALTPVIAARSPKPKPKPVVLGSKQTRSGHLAATGVGGAPLALCVALFALAALAAAPIVRRRY